MSLNQLTQVLDIKERVKDQKQIGKPLFLTSYTGLFFAGLLSAQVGLTETVVIPASQQAQGQAIPKPGLSMSKVEQTYGLPAEKFSEVGEPPISRWVYDRYTVYFEHNKVIHSVSHYRPKQALSQQGTQQQAVQQTSYQASSEAGSQILSDEPLYPE